MSCGPPADPQSGKPSAAFLLSNGPGPSWPFFMYSLNLGQKISLPGLLNTKTIHPRATNDQNRPNVDPDDDVATRGKEEPPTGTEGG